MNWPAAISVAVALPGLAAYSAFLGAVLVAAQSRDAGLPWSAVVQAHSNVSLVIEGLQVMALAGLTAAVAVSAAFGVIRYQRSTRSARRPTAMVKAVAAYRRARVVLRAFAIVVVAVIMSAVGAAAALAAMDALGLRLPGWARIAGALALAATAIARSLPLRRPMRQRPFMVSGLGIPALLGLSVWPLPWVVFFTIIAVASVVAYLWDRDIRLRWSPYAILGTYALAVGVAYAFALAATQPLTLDRVVLAEPKRAAFDARGADERAFRTAGLVALAGGETLVAACLPDDDQPGYSAEAALLKVPAQDVAITNGDYRFNAPRRLSIASLVAGDGLVSDYGQPRDDVCR